MKLFTIAIGVLFSPLAFAQTSIQNPGNYPNEVTYSSLIVGAMHTSLEGAHAKPKVATITSSGVTYSSTEFWPNGSWASGYLGSYDGADYSVFFNNQLSNHPLTRESSRFTLGYIHGHRALTSHPSNAAFGTRALDGINYHVSTQRLDGSYIWWRYRPGMYIPNVDEVTNNNSYNFYTVGYALKALAEGAWYKRCERYLKPKAERAAVIKTADFVHDHINDLTDPAQYNSNIRGLTGWGMAAAYKTTGNQTYLDDAKAICDLLISQQHSSGQWQTGGEEHTKSIPESGMADLQHWISGDFDGDGYDEVLQHYASSAIYMNDNDDLFFGIDNQYTGSGTLEKWIVGNFDSDPEDEVLHKFQGNNTIYLWNYGSGFGTNAIYTGGASIANWIAGDFDGNGIDEVLQKYSGYATIYHWIPGVTNFGANSIYTGSWHIENWVVGNFDSDPQEEVLHKFSGANTIYFWNSTSFGSNSIYTGGASLNMWLAGDFDNDNVDEVLQKYNGSTTIYLWQPGTTNFGANSVYTGGATIQGWISGDFDGDNHDEVLQKYSGINTIYRWDYGGSFNGSAPYTGSLPNTNWITADRNGDGRDELFQQFDDETIYYWDNAVNCMGCYAIFNIPQYTYYHDSRMQYQFFVLGALIETYSILSPAEKPPYAEAIKKCVNNFIARLDDTQTSKFSNVYLDKFGTVIPKFYREQESYNSREAMQQFPQIAYYAAADVTNFTSTDFDRLINLANRIVWTDYAGYTYYKDYMDAINNSTYLDYFGGCSPFVFKSEEDGQLGTEELQLEPVVSMRPNPTKDLSTLVIDGTSEGNMTISVVDLNGQVLLVSDVSISEGENNIPINLHDFEQGVYYVIVSDNSSFEQRLKLIKL